MSIWENSEALTMVKGLAAEGRSGREIAIVLTEVLGVRVTRNQVGGKCERLGIQLKGKRYSAPPKPGGPKRVRKRNSKPAVSASPVAAANGGCGRLTFARRAVAAKQGLPTAVPFCDPSPADDRADRPTSLAALKDDTCRWPFGDPGKAGFHFCGGMALDGSPYCARHGAAAHEPRIPSWLRVAAE